MSDRKIEKRIVQMWLLYPDTECSVLESENDQETVIKVVVKK